ncbi:MAG TPA: hypothetical protein VJN69_10355 [Candidatus Acidoferrales bacterium]|nr:hypothetical protein [Candidatus Acidoferrales bacterium]
MIDYEPRGKLKYLMGGRPVERFLGFAVAMSGSVWFGLTFRAHLSEHLLAGLLYGVFAAYLVKACSLSILAEAACSSASAC